MELFLRLFDPWHVQAMLNDLRQDFFLTDSARGYVLKPGVYILSQWRATIGTDGNRIIPANRQGACTLVLLGDSVTFSWGVNDADAWANLLAQQLPDIHFINTGVPGYNIQNIWETYQRYPNADGYLYLMINNDDAAEITFSTWPVMVSAIQEYLYVLNYVPTPMPKPQNMFTTYLTRLERVPHLQIVAFADNRLADNSTALRIPAYTHRISFADAHPDVIGNQEIAQHMLPIVRRLAATSCMF